MKKTFANIVAYYYKEWKEFTMPIHHHKAMEIMYVINGKCIVEVQKEKIELKKGTFIFIDSNVPHRLIVDKDSPARMLNVEFNWEENNTSLVSLEDLADRDETIKVWLEKEAIYDVFKDMDQVYPTLRQLVLALDQGATNKQLLIDSLICQLVFHLAHNSMEQREKVDNIQQLYVNKAVQYILEHYDYDIRIHDIAAATHIHPSYLHRIFKQSMDCTINTYIARVRIEKAKMLLKNTEIPITEISNYVGIQTSQYFSMLFRKHTNLTPTAYRQLFLEL